jgi:hypothetical protein
MSDPNSPCADFLLDRAKPRLTPREFWNLNEIFNRKFQNLVRIHIFIPPPCFLLVHSGLPIFLFRLV